MSVFSVAVSILFVVAVSFGIDVIRSRRRTADVLAYMKHASLRDDGYVSTLILSYNFGSGVYPIIRSLHDRGDLERREEPGGSTRGGRPTVLYRYVPKKETP